MAQHPRSEDTSERVVRLALVLVTLACGVFAYRMLATSQFITITTDDLLVVIAVLLLWIVGREYWHR